MLAAFLRRHFLSCLYGSEQLALTGGFGINFLSCLYGSEHTQHDDG